MIERQYCSNCERVLDPRQSWVFVERTVSRAESEVYVFCDTRCSDEWKARYAQVLAQR